MTVTYIGQITYDLNVLKKRYGARTLCSQQCFKGGQIRHLHLLVRFESKETKSVAVAAYPSLSETV